MVIFAGKIQLVAVRQMAAVRQIEPHDGIARLNHRRVGGLVGLRARMRLHVDVFRAKQLLRAITRQRLHLIGDLAAAVVAAAGVAFGVFVREDAAGGFENRLGSKIFAGDQLQSARSGARLLRGSTDRLRDRLPQAYEPSGSS